MRRGISAFDAPIGRRRALSQAFAPARYVNARYVNARYVNARYVNERQKSKIFACIANIQVRGAIPRLLAGPP